MGQDWRSGEGARPAGRAAEPLGAAYVMDSSIVRQADRIAGHGAAFGCTAAKDLAPPGENRLRGFSLSHDESVFDQLQWA
jgi:hypothetical protein